MSTRRNNTSSLERQTLLNYQAAMRYYAQKKAMFLKQGALKQQRDDKIFLDKYAESIVDAVDKIINKNWQKVEREIKNFISIGDYHTGSKYVVTDQKGLTASPIIPDWLKQKILTKSGTNENYYSLMGFNFETYSADMMNKVGKELVQNGLIDIMSAFKETGAKKTKSGLREGFLNIRADLAVGIEDAAGADQVLREKGGPLAVELETIFSIEDNLKNAHKTLDDNETIKKYLTSGMFGLSLKNWAKTSRPKEYTSSVKLKDMIDNEFSRSKRKTWDITYATQMVNKVVSNYLLDIIGPINIAVLTKTDLIWMDDFIGSHLFYMDIKAKNNKIYESKKGFTEIKPAVLNNSVMVRNYTMSKAIAQGRSIVKQTRLSTGEKPFTIRVQLNRKSIK